MARFLRVLATAGRVQGARSAGISGVVARRGASWRWGLLSAGGLAAVTSVVAAPSLCDDGDNVGARAGWPGVWAAGAAAAAAAWWLTPRSAASAPEADLLGWQKKWEIGQVLCLSTTHMHAHRRSLTHALTDACTHARTHAHMHTRTCTQTNFHLQSLHPALAAYGTKLLDDGIAPHFPKRIFFPLCGKAVDMPYLALEGHTVVGCDCVRMALQQLVAETQGAAISSETSAGALQVAWEAKAAKP